jgi:hypothetical protein
MADTTKQPDHPARIRFTDPAKDLGVEVNVVSRAATGMAKCIDCGMPVASHPGDPLWERDDRNPAQLHLGEEIELSCTGYGPDPAGDSESE